MKFLCPVVALCNSSVLCHLQSFQLNCCCISFMFRLGHLF
ncbi:hypothetical protein NC651_031600 [Populus alba x Populus x berolinensis]|nr:hypothetical protein NC651_031600 [Populus alba x Populus x berolinensis]